jgi:hypothetical protein
MQPHLHTMQSCVNPAHTLASCAQCPHPTHSLPHRSPQQPVPSKKPNKDSEPIAIAEQVYGSKMPSSLISPNHLPLSRGAWSSGAGGY